MKVSEKAVTQLFEFAENSKIPRLARLRKIREMKVKWEHEAVDVRDLARQKLSELKKVIERDEQIFENWKLLESAKNTENSEFLMKSELN